jgi:hypothetical protein
MSGEEPDADECDENGSSEQKQDGRLHDTIPAPPPFEVDDSDP